MRKLFQFFRQDAKSVSIFFLTRCEKCFSFFLQMRKVFHFFLTKCKKCFTCFLQNAKNVSIFLTICEKCFTFFDKMRKRFPCFLQSAKSVYKMQYRLGNFLLVYNFLVFFRICVQKLFEFLNICASSKH